MLKEISRPINLSEKQRLILGVLSRLKFATVKQLMHWTNSEHESSISRPCSELLKSGFVEQHDELTPYVFRLSRKGCNFLSTEYARSWLSFAALQQVTLKNEAEIFLRKEYRKAIHIPKKSLLKLGLNPGVGEYGFKFEKQLFLVLIDDYLMDSKRIQHSWERKHTPSELHYDLKQGGNVSWQSYADRFYLFCCDQDKLKQHEKFVLSNKIPVDLVYLPATWGIAS